MNARPMLLRLQAEFKLLRNATTGITTRMMAGQLEVCRKTVQRDMELLRDLGLAVDSQKDGWPIIGYALQEAVCPFCHGKLPAPRRNSKTHP